MSYEDQLESDDVKSANDVIGDFDEEILVYHPYEQGLKMIRTNQLQIVNNTIRTHEKIFDSESESSESSLNVSISSSPSQLEVPVEISFGKRIPQQLHHQTSVIMLDPHRQGKGSPPLLETSEGEMSLGRNKSKKIISKETLNSSYSRKHSKYRNNVGVTQLEATLSKTKISGLKKSSKSKKIPSFKIAVHEKQEPQPKLKLQLFDPKKFHENPPESIVSPSLHRAKITELVSHRKNLDLPSIIPPKFNSNTTQIDPHSNYNENVQDPQHSATCNNQENKNSIKFRPDTIIDESESKLHQKLLETQGTINNMIQSIESKPKSKQLRLPPSKASVVVTALLSRKILSEKACFQLHRRLITGGIDGISENRISDFIQALAQHPALIQPVLLNKLISDYSNQYAMKPEKRITDEVEVADHPTKQFMKRLQVKTGSPLPAASANYYHDSNNTQVSPWIVTNPKIKNLLRLIDSEAQQAVTRHFTSMASKLQNTKLKSEGDTGALVRELFEQNLTYRDILNKHQKQNLKRYRIHQKKRDLKQKKRIAEFKKLKNQAKIQSSGVETDESANEKMKNPSGVSVNPVLKKSKPTSKSPPQSNNDEVKTSLNLWGIETEDQPLASDWTTTFSENKDASSSSLNSSISSETDGVPLPPKTSKLPKSRKNPKSGKKSAVNTKQLFAEICSKKPLKRLKNNQTLNQKSAQPISNVSPSVKYLGPPFHPKKLSLLNAAKDHNLENFPIPPSSHIAIIDKNIIHCDANHPQTVPSVLLPTLVQKYLALFSQQSLGENNQNNTNSPKINQSVDLLNKESSISIDLDNSDQIEESGSDMSYMLSSTGPSANTTTIDVQSKPAQHSVIRNKKAKKPLKTPSQLKSNNVVPSTPIAADTKECTQLERPNLVEMFEKLIVKMVEPAIKVRKPENSSGDLNETVEASSSTALSDQPQSNSSLSSSYMAPLMMLIPMLLQQNQQLQAQVLHIQNPNHPPRNHLQDQIISSKTQFKSIEEAKKTEQMNTSYGFSKELPTESRDEKSVRTSKPLKLFQEDQQKKSTLSNDESESQRLEVIYDAQLAMLNLQIERVNNMITQFRSVIPVLVEKATEFHQKYPQELTEVDLQNNEKTRKRLKLGGFEEEYTQILADFAQNKHYYLYIRTQIDNIKVSSKSFPQIPVWLHVKLEKLGQEDGIVSDIYKWITNHQSCVYLQSKELAKHITALFSDPSPFQQHSLPRSWMDIQLHPLSCVENPLKTPEEIAEQYGMNLEEISAVYFPSQPIEDNPVFQAADLVEYQFPPELTTSDVNPLNPGDYDLFYHGLCPKTVHIFEDEHHEAPSFIPFSFQLDPPTSNQGSGFSSIFKNKTQTFTANIYTLYLRSIIFRNWRIKLDKLRIVQQSLYKKYIEPFLEEEIKPSSSNSDPLAKSSVSQNPPSLKDPQQSNQQPQQPCQPPAPPPPMPSDYTPIPKIPDGLVAPSSNVNPVNLSPSQIGPIDAPEIFSGLNGMDHQVLAKVGLVSFCINACLYQTLDSFSNIYQLSTVFSKGFGKNRICTLLEDRPFVSTFSFSKIPIHRRRRFRAIQHIQSLSIIQKKNSIPLEHIFPSPSFVKEHNSTEWSLQYQDRVVTILEEFRFDTNSDSKFHSEFLNDFLIDNDHFQDPEVLNPESPFSCLELFDNFLPVESSTTKDSIKVSKDPHVQSPLSLLPNRRRKYKFKNTSFINSDQTHSMLITCLGNSVFDLSSNIDGNLEPLPVLPDLRLDRCPKRATDSSLWGSQLNGWTFESCLARFRPPAIIPVNQFKDQIRVQRKKLKKRDLNRATFSSRQKKSNKTLSTSGSVFSSQKYNFIGTSTLLSGRAKLKKTKNRFPSKSSQASSKALMFQSGMLKDIKKKLKSSKHTSRLDRASRSSLKPSKTRTNISRISSRTSRNSLSLTRKKSRKKTSILIGNKSGSKTSGLLKEPSFSAGISRVKSKSSSVSTDTELLQSSPILADNVSESPSSQPPLQSILEKPTPPQSIDDSISIPTTKSCSQSSNLKETQKPTPKSLEPKCIQEESKTNGKSIDVGTSKKSKPIPYHLLIGSEKHIPLSKLESLSSAHESGVPLLSPITNIPTKTPNKQNPTSFSKPSSLKPLFSEPTASSSKMILSENLSKIESKSDIVSNQKTIKNPLPSSSSSTHSPKSRKKNEKPAAASSTKNHHSSSPKPKRHQNVSALKSKSPKHSKKAKSPRKSPRKSPGKSPGKSPKVSGSTPKRNQDGKFQSSASSPKKSPNSLNRSKSSRKRAFHKSPTLLNKSTTSRKAKPVSASKQPVVPIPSTSQSHPDHHSDVSQLMNSSSSAQEIKTLEILDALCQKNSSPPTRNFGPSKRPAASILQPKTSTESIEKSNSIQAFGETNSIFVSTIDSPDFNLPRIPTSNLDPNVNNNQGPNDNFQDEHNHPEILVQPSNVNFSDEIPTRGSTVALDPCIVTTDNFSDKFGTLPMVMPEFTCHTDQNDNDSSMPRTASARMIQHIEQLQRKQTPTQNVAISVSGELSVSNDVLLVSKIEPPSQDSSHDIFLQGSNSNSKPRDENELEEEEINMLKNLLQNPEPLDIGPLPDSLAESNSTLTSVLSQLSDWLGPSDNSENSNEKVDTLNRSFSTASRLKVQLGAEIAPLSPGPLPPSKFSDSNSSFSDLVNIS